MNHHIVLATFHIIVVVPFFLYVGFTRAANPEWMYNVLLGLGLFLFVYHAYSAAKRFLSRSPYIWVNLIHALLIAPLLVWIGVSGKKTPRAAYEMLLLVAFAALGYHMYNLFLEVNIITDIDA
jgi:hypothetical protein